MCEIHSQHLLTYSSQPEHITFRVTRYSWINDLQEFEYIGVINCLALFLTLVSVNDQEFLAHVGSGRQTLQLVKKINKSNPVQQNKPASLDLVSILFIVCRADIY